MDWIHRCMILPDAIRDQVKALAVSFDPSTDGMWTTPLSPSGELPATHWISVGFIQPDFASVIPYRHAEITGTTPDGKPVYTWVDDHYDATAFVALAQKLGVTPLPTVEQIEALMSVCDVSSQTGFDAMARLGLKMIQPKVI